LTGADAPAWYRVGGIAAVLLGLGYLVITPLYVLAGTLPVGGEASLEYLAERTTVWWAIVGLSILTDILFLPMAVALYVALERVDRMAMLAGTGLLALFVILDLAVTWPSIAAQIVLSGEHASTADAALRAAYVAAAEYASAVRASIGVYTILVPSLGILIIGVVMLRGAFGRVAGWLGVLTGVLGTIAVVGALFVSALGALAIATSVLTTAWVLVVGYLLLRLARGRPQAV
jgi:hypothetical protein